MTLQLSTSSRRGTFRLCPKKHELAYIDGWKTVTTSTALRIGTAVHTGLEAWWVDPFPESALNAVSGAAKDEYEQAKLDAMLIGYHEKWKSEAKHYEVIGVELGFEAPMLHHKTLDSFISWGIAGKIDGLVIDKRTRETVIVEHKTCSEEIEGDDANYWQKLTMDDQCSAYVVGANALGYDPSTIIYDVIRKPSIRPRMATPVEKRRKKKNGDYYANVRLDDETAQEYHERVLEDIRSRPSHYYQRRSVPRMASQVKAFMQDTWDLTQLMDFSEASGIAPRNPDACFKYGRACGFYDICTLGLDPEDHPDRWVKKTSQNEELEEEKNDDGDDDWFAEFDPGRTAAHA